MFTETHLSLSSLWAPLKEKFFHWIVYSNLWVASGITSLIVFVQHSLALAWDWHPYGLIFSAALIPYILDRAVDTVVQPMANPQVQDRFRTTGIWLLLAGAVTVTGVLIYQAPTAVGWVCLGGLVPLIYGLPIFPGWRQPQIRWYRLKDIPGAKAWLVCGSITYGVVAVPVACAGVEVDTQVILTALFFLMFIGTNTKKLIY